MKRISVLWGRYFLTLELLTAIGLAASVMIWSEFFNGKNEMGLILGDNLTKIYENLAAVFGTLLGFVITAVSIVLGYINNKNLSLIRRSERYEDLWKVYKSAMRSLAVATAAGLAGIIFEKMESLKYPLIYINALTITLAFFRLGRSIWVLENIITIVTQQTKITGDQPQIRKNKIKPALKRQVASTPRTNPSPPSARR